MARHTLGSAESLLKNGEMKRFELGETPIVVARVDDQYYAFEAACTHYHGNLDQGLLQGHTIMCPLHHACFDIRSGLRLEPPAINDLPTYPLTIENGDLTVDLAPSAPADPLPSVHSTVNDILIVGGGAAGESAAEALRRLGYEGSITLLSASPLLPIDRPNVSKDYLAGEAPPEWMPLRDAGWYADQRITVRTGVRVNGVNLDDHTVSLDSGEAVTYQKLLLATGGVPRTLPIPGVELGNIFTLRDQPDADRIIAALGDADGIAGKNVVIVGSSFIGMEAAASLKQRGATVTVFDMVDVPFERILGREIGSMILKTHEENGITFHLGTRAALFEGEHDVVQRVVLENGTTLPADVVLMGVGVKPATEFLEASGLAMDARDRSLIVNRFLQTSHDDVYAAGDIAHYADESPDGNRIEHWRVAQQHGIVAAHNLTGNREDVNAHTPFFWTTQWDLNLRYVGSARAWDEILVRGDVAAKNFVAFFVSDGKLAAAAGVKRDQEMLALEVMLRDRLPLSTEQMSDPAFDLMAFAVQPNA